MEAKLKVLYAENDAAIAQITRKLLEKNGFDVYWTSDGNDTWKIFQEAVFDIILLSLRLPYKSGIDLFLLIREINPYIPVLILGADPKLCASSLQIGVDDFVRKDADIEEICARIHIAYDRHQSQKTDHPTHHLFTLSPHTTFDSLTRILTVQDQQYRLSTVPAQILYILCLNQNQYLPSAFICKKIWNNDTPGKIRLLQDYLSQLRKHLCKDPQLNLLNQYGRGYCLYAAEI